MEGKLLVKKKRHKNASPKGIYFTDTPNIFFEIKPAGFRNIGNLSGKDMYHVVKRKQTNGSHAVPGYEFLTRIEAFEKIKKEKLRKSDTIPSIPGFIKLPGDKKKRSEKWDEDDKRWD